MPPSSSLNLAGQLYEEQLKVAWKHSRAGEHDKANDLARWLVMRPDIGRAHAAGAHLLLAHSPDDKVYHAKKALELYKALNNFGDPNDDHARPGPTKRQQQAKNELVKIAEEVLGYAEEDEKRFGLGPSPDEVDDMLANAKAVLDERERTQRAGRAGEDDTASESESGVLSSDEDESHADKIDEELEEEPNTENASGLGVLGATADSTAAAAPSTAAAATVGKRGGKSAGQEYVDYDNVLLGYSPSHSPAAMEDGMLTPHRSEEFGD